jgi:hypothetical protein
MSFYYYYYQYHDSSSCIVHYKYMFYCSYFSGCYGASNDTGASIGSGPLNQIGATRF